MSEDYKIEIEGRNNVKVTPMEIMMDVEGKEVKVYNASKTESYGLELLLQKLAYISIQIENLNSIDPILERQKKLDSLNEEKIKLLVVKEKLQESMGE